MPYNLNLNFKYIYANFLFRIFGGLPVALFNIVIEMLMHFTKHVQFGADARDFVYYLIYDNAVMSIVTTLR